MKIIFFTVSDKNDPASRYRGYNIAKEVKNKFYIKTKIYHEPFEFPKKRISNYFYKISTLSKVSKEDFLYFQRTNSYTSLWYLICANILNKKTVYDFDDAIFLICPKKTAVMVKLANVIIAGNTYLANYAKNYNKNVFVVPTSINLKSLKGIKKDYSKKNKKIIIGWIGTYGALKFLEEIRIPLKKLYSKYNIELRIIGPKDSINALPKFKDLNVKIVPWNIKTEWKELSKIDIGIMPLPDNPWTKGKCGLKILQYMALGIPTVASGVGMNKEIIKNGKNGFLALNEKEWIYYLEKLIKNKKLREKIGEEGRKTIEEKYSLKKNVKKIIDYFIAYPKKIKNRKRLEKIRILLFCIPLIIISLLSAISTIIICVIDKDISKVGIFLKKHHPKLYFKLKKLKNKFGLKCKRKTYL